MAGTSLFAVTPSIFESLVLKLIFIVKPLCNISLGPGSVVGGKAKNGMNQEELRRAKRAEWWTGEEGKAA